MIHTKDTTPPLLLTKREAGLQMRVTERTVHDLIAKGLLPAVRLFAGHRSSLGRNAPFKGETSVRT